MTGTLTAVQDDFLATARAAAALLREEAVAAAWDGPSALPGFTVRGLAGHLAYQVLCVAPALTGPEPRDLVVSLLGHYARVGWIGAAADADANVRIRQGGEDVASEGHAVMTARLAAALEELPALLRPADADRPVRIPLWGPWSLRLDDLLVTRMMELAVHNDDLAVSVGTSAPELPERAADTVVALLARLARRRHGSTAVLRALARAERAPASIAAF
ncbi:maleylpyruvate isomerase N-terminal domain-containing protein [Streptomyces klenkii]|uniref:maleylpyruvate isomerase N-terminal domain-containing protein n=1 Tax=Streptomyces klenkii TaxID=1420899 RepID=UPI001F546EAE|nr:maleylpyruvate isomerase N-terminal domain-containing protein [Streptomyces klenkii]